MRTFQVTVETIQRAPFQADSEGDALALAKDRFRSPFLPSANVIYTVREVEMPIDQVAKMDRPSPAGMFTAERTR